MGPPRMKIELRTGGGGAIQLGNNLAFAKLQGVVFGGEDNATEHRFEFFMTSEKVVLGRSGGDANAPLDVVNAGVDLGVGDSSKLSRRHAQISWNPENQAFEISCMGRNGLTVTQNGMTQIMVPETAPQSLGNRALVQLGDCLFVFMLPLAGSTMRAPQDWIKADHKTMHSLILRFGYGRWDAIRENSGGRLEDKPDEELVYVARKLIAKCCIHAKAGIEKKTLREVLKEDLPEFMSPEEVAQQVEKDLKEAEGGTDPGEKRKYLRWARKLRLLRNLRDAANHSSVEKLRDGKLTIHSPPPAPWWTAADDYSLLIGTYKRGYGSTDQIRDDPQLSFFGRVVPATPSKAKKSPVGTGGTPNESDGEDDEEEEEEDEDDEGRKDPPEKKETTVDDGKQEEVVAEVGDEDAKKEDSDSNTPVEDKPEGATLPTDANMKSEVKETERKAVKTESMVVDGAEEGKTHGEVESEEKVDSNDETPQTTANGKDSRDESDVVMKDSASDGANTAELTTKYIFPNPDALMRRLKSVINACMREVERDLREESRVREHQEKIRQREEARQDAAVAKQERYAAKVREREERRISRMQPFSKRDAVDFVRNLVDMGIAYKDGNQRDWQWFINRVEGLKHKYPETLEEAYKSLVQECHTLLEERDREVMSDDDEEGKKPLEQTMFVHNLERAEKVLERLEFFQYLRTSVLVYPTLAQTLRGVKRPKELPDWWRSVHDRGLLNGVNKYGLNNWEAVEADADLGFEAALKTYKKKHDGQGISERRMAFPKPGACQRRVKKIIDHFRTRASTAANVSVDPTESPAVKTTTASDRPRKEAPASTPATKTATATTTLTPAASAAKKKKLKKQVYQRPTLPYQVSQTLKVIDFGEVAPEREGWHDQEHIFPVGFKSVRSFNEREYLFEIMDPGEGELPLFSVKQVGGPEPITAKTANEAWRKVTSIQGNDLGASVMSGLEAMGLLDARLRNHIKHLPRANECLLFKHREKDTPEPTSQRKPGTKRSKETAALITNNERERDGPADDDIQSDEDEEPADKRRKHNEANNMDDD